MEVLKKASRIVCTSTVVVSPYPLSPTPNSSAMKTVSPSSSASLVKTEETTGNTDAPEPVAEGDIQMERPCDQLCSLSTGAVTKYYL
jgi:hypothetical protein